MSANGETVEAKTATDSGRRYNRNIDRLIGQFIIRRRKQLKVSQFDLSQFLKIKESLVCQYEAGKIHFTPDMLIEIANFLKIEPSQLFTMLAQQKISELSFENLKLEPAFSIASEPHMYQLALADLKVKIDDIIDILGEIKSK